jgi:putative CocE/NonD family hydrolase
MPRRIGLVALVLALVAGATVALGPARAADPAPEVRETGYVATRDGTQLHYTVVRPAGPGPFPTLLTYDGYDAGFNPDPGYIAEYVPDGYAFIGVSLRGSGCSGGVWDFFQPKEATDGYDVIEWIAQQPWSNGRVAMIGKSYPGITQLFVGATRPPHLVAIAPGHTFGDIYRDIAYPGGILNYGFNVLWSFVSQPYSSDGALLQKTAAGDQTCAANIANRPQTKANTPFFQSLQHQWDDGLIRERSPGDMVQRIAVPTWTVAAWQDEQVGPREVDWISRMRAPVYGIVSNGSHSIYRYPPALAELHRFMDHFVKGIDNGFDRRPAHFQVWWETGRDGERAPGFTSWTDHWPVRSRTRKLLLDEGGALTAPAGKDAVQPGGSDTFAYAGPTGSGQPNAAYGEPSLPNHQLYGDMPRVPGTFVDYTTAPLARTQPVLGTASADLWISATAPDTDLQVTLTEVRPDGQEMFVQQGWLRASHRTLDPARSTPTRPYQTHQQADQTFLVPGQPTPVRVEIFPFGHVFRAGSRIRITIEAPKPLPDLWAFAPLPVPSVTTVLHDAAHPSALVFSEPSGNARPADVPPLPACGTVSHQPCRAAS